MSTTINEWRKWLRRAGLILGLLLGGLFSLAGLFFASLGGGFPITSGELSLEDWPFLVPGLIVISSVAVAWKWELTGAILLNIVGLFVLINMFIPGIVDVRSVPFEIAAFLVILNFNRAFSLILLVPGVLFLVSWWVRRSQS